MKKRLGVVTLTVMGIFLFSAIFAACANQVAERGTVQAKTAAPAAVATTPKAVAATKPAPATPKPLTGAALYEGTPKPLTPVECGRCHTGEYNDLKQSKTKHRFACTKCHTKFHRYNPIKKNWKAIMPKCQRCHGYKHGKAFPNCMQCHINPHSPRTIKFASVTKMVTLKKGKKIIACGLCHKKEYTEMAKNPCAHNTEVGCQGCHADKHGYIPNCLDCHEPHVQGQKFKDCLVCHSPHSALKIKKYPVTTPSKICGSCHTTEYEHLRDHHTKHSNLTCAKCHDKHGFIPKCQKCHGYPHGAGLHKRFPNCLECHIDPHNLPTIGKK